MSKVIDKLTKRADTKARHKKKRLKLMGEEGMVKQNHRAAKEKIKAAFNEDDTVDKANTRETIKRVGEYKKGEFSGYAGGGAVGRSQRNRKAYRKTEKMAKGGQVCRGMGSAVRGGKYGKDG